MFLNQAVLCQGSKMHTAHFVDPKRTNYKGKFTRHPPNLSRSPWEAGPCGKDAGAGRGRAPSRVNTALFGYETMTYDIIVRKPNYQIETYCQISNM